MKTIEQNIEKQDLNNFNEISEKICDEINEKVNMIYDEIIKSVLPSSLAKNVIKIKNNLEIDKISKKVEELTKEFLKNRKEQKNNKKISKVGSINSKEEAEKIISAIKECCNLTQIENKKIEENKNKISKQFEEKIQDNIKVAVKLFNENGKNINKWKEAFNNKNFMKMEKIYKEIEKNKVNTVSIEENIKELKKIENMHLLIKRKGGDFNLTNEELELVEKLT